MAVSRRDFLRGSGGALLFGSAFAGAPLAALAGTEPAPQAAPAASGLEKWLLETGKREIDGDVYDLVARQAR